MKKYKGFNVPDVKDFFSTSESDDLLSDIYCIVSECKGECKGTEKEFRCLFSRTSKELTDWHNARLKGVKNGMV